MGTLQVNKGPVAFGVFFYVEVVIKVILCIGEKLVESHVPAETEAEILGDEITDTDV